MVNIKIQIPDEFYNEEIRSGFTVTEERKKLWAVELDLLNQLDTVCKKHSLSYMLGAGSLLGAVRHKGFIPWDDDIDVYMLRGDYDKLQHCWRDFEEPYFLQSGYTELEYERKHAQLRNSNTTALIHGDENRNINRGVFIDIFPIDGVSDDESKNLRQRKIDNWFDGWWSNYLRKSCKTRQQKIKRSIIRAITAVLGKQRLYHAMEKNLSRYSVADTEMWGNRTLDFDCPRSKRPLEDYSNMIETEFEGFQFPIPANYDAILQQQYGDYMTIPKNRPTSMHGGMTVSTDVSYAEYLKKHR